MGLERLELSTSRLSGVRSNHLSYRPVSAWSFLFRRRQARRCLGHLCLDRLPASTARLPCRNKKSRRGTPLQSGGVKRLRTVTSSHKRSCRAAALRRRAASIPLHQNWWSWSGSNRRPPACKADALPAELQPQAISLLLKEHTWLIESEQRAGRGSLKEVIQPQVPLRLPCYDFTPIIGPTVDGCLPIKGLAYRLRVKPTFVV